ncbi:MAG: SCO family protein [SAR324 cluster bacterium]|nr:SCO family protein [SAR324 cluster bacterium]
MAANTHLKRFLIRIAVLFVLVGGSTTVIVKLQNIKPNQEQEVISNSSGTDQKGRLQFYEGLGGNFTLHNHHGESASLEDFKGKVVLVNFGYTNCPDICPMVLSRLKQLMKKLDNQVDQVQTLFITIDPERDTAEHLKSYMAHFHPSFIGLTGTLEEIEKTARQYGAAFIRQEVESDLKYLFAHSDYVYLIDKKGNLRAFYRSDATLEQITEDIKTLLAQ